MQATTLTGVQALDIADLEIAEMEKRSKAIVHTLLVCLAASVTACVLKILYGKQSGSLAFIADGIHSLFDSLATATGIASVLAAAKPPDEGHPYGHHKFETISAMALGMLLFIAAYEVGNMAYQRLSSSEIHPEFSGLGLAILFGTMALNLGVAFMEGRMAKKLGSKFLAADSLHNQSDFLITCAVLVTMVSVHFGIPYVDAGVSLVITFYLVFLALRLIASNVQPLVDSSVLDSKVVTDIASSTPGVIYCHSIRSRGERGHYFLDLNIHLPGNITLSRAHEITHNVESRLKAAFPGLADVIIHTEPHDHPPCSKD